MREFLDPVLLSTLILKLPRIRVVLCTVLIGHKFTGFCQGTVNLNNNFFRKGSNEKAYVNWTGVPIPKEHGRVEIVSAFGEVIKSGTFGADGLFFLGVVEIPGAPIGGHGWITIRAGDARVGWLGAVVVHLVGLGGGLTPPPSLGAIGDFVGMDAGVLTPSGPESVTIHVGEDGKLRVGAIVQLWNGLRVWSSTNLLDWAEAGPPQILFEDLVQCNCVEWLLQPIDPVSYFRVESAIWRPLMEP